MRKITVAENAGFCYGVNRAADMLDSLLAQGKKVCTLGPLVHNRDYIKELEGRGVRVIDDPGLLPEDYCLLIRSHGIALELRQRLESRGIECFDATCPSVAKIADIAASADKGRIFLLAGDREHPEVIGIMSHAPGQAFTFANSRELQNLLTERPDLAHTELLAAVQTTFQPQEWEKCKEILKKDCTNIKIFDTICRTTRLRQSEAEQLAAASDLMIVVGGSDSSNTRRLFDTCNAITRTVWIQNAGQLDAADFEHGHSIGVVAGASTPVKNIMEVVHKMDENKDVILENGEEFNYEQALEESFKRLSKADTIKGIVTAIHPNEVAVDIGRKHAGYVPLSELTNDPNAKIEDLVKIGDELTLMVMKTNDVDGTVMMSKKRVDANASWLKVIAAKDTGEVLEGVVTENVGGGVIVSCDGARVFIPGSHTGIPREGNLDTLLKTTVKFVIIDIEERGHHKRAVGSIRKASSAGRKEATEKFWETAKVGDVIVGKVRSIAPFGVFVNVGGPDGLVHSTELSWTRFKNIEDVVEVGQDLKVIIKELDPEKKRISLTHKLPEDDPFEQFLAKYSVEDVVNVTITSIVAYGAFAEIIPGVEGLIHISNISNSKIGKVADVLSRGQKIDAKIIDINTQTRKISLSIRALLSDEPVASADEPTVEAEAEQPAAEEKPKRTRKAKTEDTAETPAE